VGLFPLGLGPLQVGFVDASHRITSSLAGDISRSGSVGVGRCS
jgi:hypothetical protein